MKAGSRSERDVFMIAYVPIFGGTKFDFLMQRSASQGTIPISMQFMARKYLKREVLEYNVGKWIDST